MRPLLLKTATFALCCALLSACASTDTQTQALKEERDQIESDITRAIGPASCTEQRQCRVLPMGAKPCGGASHFKVYSVTNTDETKLNQMAARHSQISALLQRGSGRMSACQLATPPLIYCENSQCVGRER